jgi:hypothetical protein
MYQTFYSVNIFSPSSELLEVVYKTCIKIGVKLLLIEISLSRRVLWGRLSDFVM